MTDVRVLAARRVQPAVASDPPRAVDLRGVRLLPSHWQRQYERARHYYVEQLAVDDVLHGFRRAAGLPAPGRPLTGWCRDDSKVVFGQWLSTLARMAATGDVEAGTKAIDLVRGWAETYRTDPHRMMQHYPFDKLIGGLVDLTRYVPEADVQDLMRDLTLRARAELSRTNTAASPWPPELADGDELEWYTLSENLLRAWETTGDEMYRSFAGEWFYHAFWDKFHETSAPADVHGLHAYSHLNTFSSAAMAWRATADPRYLTIATNAHAWFRNSQCYATGGFGPSERTMPYDGSLGRALESRMDSFEVCCGSWAAFKLDRYLTIATGLAHYGDWTERLLCNGVGAALDIVPGGQHTYYADYRIAGSVKHHCHHTYACCAGSYGQAVTDYHDLAFYRGNRTLYVSQFIPAEIELELVGVPVKVRQTSTYPVGDEVTLQVFTPQPVKAALALRQPGWAPAFTVEINGVRVETEAGPDGWVRVDRNWREGDVVRYRLPMSFRTEPVDEQHTQRVAVMRGPSVMAFEGGHHEPFPEVQRDLDTSLVADEDRPGRWTLLRWRGRDLRLGLRPYHQFGAHEPHRVYVDADAPPTILW